MEKVHSPEKPLSESTAIPPSASKPPFVPTVVPNRPLPKSMAVPVTTKVVAESINFACLYHCALSSEPWPESVLAYGKASPHNDYLLSEVKRIGASNEAYRHDLVLRLIDGLLSDLAS